MCNGLLRIEEASELAKEIFAFKHEYGDFHALEMIQYAQTDIDTFVSKPISLLEQYSEVFDYYRRCGYEMFLFVSFQQGAASVHFGPTLLSKLGENGATLEIMEFTDDFI